MELSEARKEDELYLFYCYRYENSKGYGPFYDKNKNLYNWKDNGWRYGCDSIEKLNEWWFSMKYLLNLKKYHIVKYTIKIKKDFRLFKIKNMHLIDFKLDEVINKENIN